MQYTNAEGSQGICPTGWHIPKFAEFHTLSNTVGGDGNALKAVGQGTGDGVGTNSTGFSALLAGWRMYDSPFWMLGGHTFFWISTEDSLIRLTYYLCLRYNKNDFYFNYFYWDAGFSVRCLKD
jgi:uncharacterized protein (TIGR02145 family)